MTTQSSVLSPQSSSWRVGIDIGGTFVDLVAVDDRGSIYHTKSPSTPRTSLADGIVGAIGKAVREGGLQANRVHQFAHGTTVGTNAVLERKGVATGLVTTAGFRDVLEIGRQNRGDLYDLLYDRPEPLVPRNLRAGVAERVASDGAMLVGLDEAGLQAAVDDLVAQGIRSLAICFLHSYRNPANERRAAEVVQTAYPDLPVSLSSEVLPEFREYERTSTTVLNAYLRPVIDRYLQELEARLRELGISAAIHVMQSNGGIMSSGTARQKAVYAVLSGPAAGVTGAAEIARLAGYRELITLDMGGTSCDVSLIGGGRAAVTTEGNVGDFPIRFPIVDIHTIGAGGGSLARVEAGRRLKVGPESAGADPGPVCYRKGGERPTVTDANVVLGRIDPDYFLGGEIPLDRAAAEEAIRRTIAEPLGLDLVEAAHGIVDISNAQMVGAIRVISVERGHDPRRFSLLAFGGAGAVQAGRLARMLSIPRVIVPELAGALSAFGLLVADVQHDFVRTYVGRLDGIDPAVLEALYGELRASGERTLRQEGFGEGDWQLFGGVDVRYLGQAYEVNVPAPVGPLDRAALASIAAEFHRQHEQAYGHCAPEEPVELVNVRLSAIGRTARPRLERYELEGPDPRPALKQRRLVSFVRGEPAVEAPVYERARLRPGNRVVGPAVIEQRDSTTVVYPDQIATTDDYRNLVVQS